MNRADPGRRVPRNPPPRSYQESVAAHPVRTSRRAVPWIGEVGSARSLSSVRLFRNSTRSRFSASVIAKPRTRGLCQRCGSAFRVVVDDLFERRESPVMHVRSGDRDVPEGRRSESAAESVVVECGLGFRTAFPGGGPRKRETGVALRAGEPLREEEPHAAPGGLGERAMIVLPDEPVVRRVAEMIVLSKDAIAFRAFRRLTGSASPGNAAAKSFE